MCQPRTDIMMRPATNYADLVRSGMLLPFHQYHKIIVSFSGGKDSVALALQTIEMAIEQNYPLENIEFWHQNIDGDPDAENFMDWPCTHAYVKAVAQVLGITLRFQWKDQGFEGELLRQDVSTAGVYYEDEFGAVQYVEPQKPSSNCKCGHSYSDATWSDDVRRWRAEVSECPSCGKSRRGIDSRLRWPAKGADLQTRWCSGYLKIDVCKRAINNDPRFKEANILVLTGERREESAARKKYDEVVPHGSNNKSRRVDQWRGVIDWAEEDVWDIIERWRIVPHPAYRLGWDRVSCALCIFGGPDQLASARQIMPRQFGCVSGYEDKLGHTISHERKGRNVIALPVVEMASRGTSFVDDAPQWLVDLAMNKAYPMDMVFVPDGEQWTLPKGAFKKTGCGPI